MGKTAFSFLELRASKGINLALITVSKNKTSHNDNVVLFKMHYFIIYYSFKFFSLCWITTRPHKATSIEVME